MKFSQITQNIKKSYSMEKNYNDIMLS